jgi:hypothetical protein
LDLLVRRKALTFRVPNELSLLFAGVKALERCCNGANSFQIVFLRCHFERSIKTPVGSSETYCTDR